MQTDGQVKGCGLGLSTSSCGEVLPWSIVQQLREDGGREGGGGGGGGEGGGGGGGGGGGVILRIVKAGCHPVAIARVVEH